MYSVRLQLAFADPDRPLLAINAFDDPIIDNGKSLLSFVRLCLYRVSAAIPISEIQSSSHVYLVVTPGGGHLGYLTSLTTKDRWIRRPVSEFLTAATRDLPRTDTAVEFEESDGWEWVRKAAHAVSGVGGAEGRIGWRILKKGELVMGAEGSGTLQGL